MKQVFTVVFLSMVAALGVITISCDGRTIILDKGGVSVDLSKCGPREIETIGKNLIKNGGFEEIDTITKEPKQWRNGIYFHLKKVDLDKQPAFLKRFTPYSLRSVSNTNSFAGKKCAKISLSPEVRNDGKGEPQVSSKFMQTLTVRKCSVDTTFILTFMCRGKIAGVPGNNGLIPIVTFIGENRKFLGSSQKTITLPKEWRKASMFLTAPAGTVSINIYLNLYGCGKIFLDNVSLKRTMIAKGVKVREEPFSDIDNTFYLSSGQPGIMLIPGCNSSGAKMKNPFIFLQLPNAIKLLDVGVPATITDISKSSVGGEKTTTYKVSVKGFRFAKDGYTMFNAPSFMLTTTLPAGSKNLKATYWYVDGDYKTHSRELNLKIISTISAKTPKLFKTAPMLARDGYLHTTVSAKKYAEFLRNCGFNCVHLGSGADELSRMLKNLGLKLYTEPYWLCNGYRIGNDPKPEVAKFRMVNGGVYKDAYDCICPVEVYDKGEYYTKNVVQKLRKIIADDGYIDEIMSNWEPNGADFKGCFCLKCKKEFIKFSGLSEKEVDAVWPKKVIIKYRDKWIKFRSWQHAKLLVQLQKTIHAIGAEVGKNSNFIPEIVWCSVTENGNPLSGQHNPLDYLDKLPVIEPWGPYICQKFNQPYAYQLGAHQTTYAAAMAVRNFIDKYVPEKEHQPAIIAFPNGYQLNDWVTEPEAIAFEMLCFFLNRWDGAFLYYFPRGYDARYFVAVAKTNTLIAEYEKFVFKGRKSAEITVAPVSPLPKIDCNDGVNFLNLLPWLKTNPSLLQSVEYRLGEKRLAAVGNFWVKGDAFFKLSFKNLRKGRKYVLRQLDKHRCFTGPNGNTALSAKQLKRGILLHVGALRWAFFVLEPFKKGVNFQEMVTPGQMSDAMKRRLPEIKKTSELEEKIISENSDANKPVKVKIDIPKTTLGKLVCFTQNGKIVFEFGKARLIVDPVKGAKIASWIVDGMEMVNKSNDNLGLAVDAFWWPKNAVSILGNTRYEFVKSEKKRNSISVIFKQKLTKKNCPGLPGVTLTKTITMYSKDGGVKIATKITNTTSSTIKFSFRFHNMLTFLETRNGEGGRAVFDNGSKSFERLFMVKLYRFKGRADKELEKAFHMDDVSEITEPDVVFKCPWSKLKLYVAITNPADLHSFIFWDTGNMICSTFEPLFKRMTLEQKKSWTAGMTWRVDDSSNSKK